MINEQIRDKEIRLIGSNGEQLGIMSARDAMKLAREAELDLVKIAPTAKPPVCKIIDYGKYRYELARKEKEAKKKQKPVYLFGYGFALLDSTTYLSAVVTLDSATIDSKTTVLNSIARYSNQFRSYLEALNE